MLVNGSLKCNDIRWQNNETAFRYGTVFATDFSNLKCRTIIKQLHLHKRKETHPSVRDDDIGKRTKQQRRW